MQTLVQAQEQGVAWRRTILQEVVLRRPEAVTYCAAPGIGVVLVQSYAHHMYFLGSPAGVLLGTGFAEVCTGGGVCPCC